MLRTSTTSSWVGMSADPWAAIANQNQSSRGLDWFDTEDNRTAFGHDRPGSVFSSGSCSGKVACLQRCCCACFARGRPSVGGGVVRLAVLLCIVVAAGSYYANVPLDMSSSSSSLLARSLPAWALRPEHARACHLVLCAWAWMAALSWVREQRGQVLVPCFVAGVFVLVVVLYPPTTFRADNRCGAGWGAPGALAGAWCEGDSGCSRFNWCGQGPDFSTCEGCIDYSGLTTPRTRFLQAAAVAAVMGSLILVAMITCSGSSKKARLREKQNAMQRQGWAWCGGGSGLCCGLLGRRRGQGKLPGGSLRFQPIDGDDWATGGGGGHINGDKVV